MHARTHTHAHTQTHTFNDPFSGTTQVSRYQKGKINLDFVEARDSEWQWNQLGHMQVCTSFQTDNHACTSPLSFLHDGCPSCHPTNSVKALKASNEVVWSTFFKQVIPKTTDLQFLFRQETQLSPSDHTMHLVSSNLANYHATVQKLLIRQVLTKMMVWSWRFSWRQCVINKPTTVELCISPVYRWLIVAKFSKSTM